MVKIIKVLWNLDVIGEIKKWLDYSLLNIIVFVEDIDEFFEGINILVINFFSVILDIFSEFCEKEIIYN